MKMNMKGKLSLISGVCLILVLLTLTFTSACAKPAPTEKVTLKSVSSWTVDHMYTKMLLTWQDRITKRSNGRIAFETLGSAEVIKENEQPKAVQTGIVDIANTATAYAVNQVPEVQILPLSRLTPKQQRDTGLWSYLDEAYQKKINSRLLIDAFASPRHFYMNKPVQHPSDFKGLRIRGSTTDTPFITALGAAPLNLSVSELYEALQRNLVDGTGQPEVGFIESKFNEVTKYRIDPGFYRATGIIMMNLDTWKSLPQDLQEIITKASVEIEEEARKYFDGLADGELAELKKQGYEVIVFQGAEAEQFLKTAYDAMAATIIKKNPELESKVKELLIK